MRPGRRTDTLDPIAERLHAIAHESSELAEAASLYEAVLPLVRDADVNVTPVDITAEQAREKMNMGLPLLAGLDLEIDFQGMSELVSELACAVESAGQNGSRIRFPWTLPQEICGFQAEARRIRLAFEKEGPDIEVLRSFISAGEKNAVHLTADHLKLHPGLLLLLVRNSFIPAFRAWRRQLDPLIEGVTWRKDKCYVCGAPAVLAELQDNDQVRHLRCGSCGGDWAVNRLRCSSCGNEDHRTQKYLYEQDRCDTRRVEVCEQCKTYVKVIAAFAPNSAEMLAIEDLATLHLDYLAQGQGYARIGYGSEK